MASWPLHWRMRHFIDANKGCTSIVVMALIVVYDAWDNPTIWLYGAEHGLYGLLWISKSRLFADKQFEQPIAWGAGLGIFAVLCLYWITPFIIVSQQVRVPPWYTGLSVLSFGAGVFLHFVSDMQKHMHLRLRPGTLLTDGLWRRTRNPNYLGELFIYAGFGMLGRHWAPFAVLGLFIAGIWIPNIRRKEASLGRYQQFAAYKRATGLIFPRLAALRPPRVDS